MSFWSFWKSNKSRPAARAKSSSRLTRFERLESREMLTSVSGDFNGDGIADLAIGIPGKDLGAAVNAGSVSVIYGTNSSGLSPVGNQVWNLDRPGVIGVARSYDRLGSSLAAGDFNGDGFSDLAIGLPGRRNDRAAAAGAVLVLYGSVNGLTSGNNQLWTQSNIGFNIPLERATRFGSALTTGDFNGDGRDDLAIGTPFQSLGKTRQIGMVYVLYGTFSGLTDAGSQRWSLRSTGIVGTEARNGQFGASLTTGDFNNDGFADLGIGSPGSNVVNVIYGTSNRLRAAGNQQWTGSSTFGTALAAGDFNGDSFSDLAASSEGSVSVIYGSRRRLTSAGRQTFTPRNMSLDAASAKGFGKSLAAGDFDADRYDDLVIGAPLAKANDLVAAGQIFVLQGSSKGVTTVDMQTIAGNTVGLNAAEAHNHFGWSLAVGDYDGDGYIDLGVGIPNKRVGSVLNVGQVQAFYGSDTGLRRVQNQTWRQGFDGILGTSVEGDGFGRALA